MVMKCPTCSHDTCPGYWLELSSKFDGVDLQTQSSVRRCISTLKNLD